MKKFLSLFLTACILITVSGCGNESAVVENNEQSSSEASNSTTVENTNVFATDDAIKCQIGRLCYTVPSNSIVVEGENQGWTESHEFSVLIDNSAETYSIVTGYMSSSDAAAGYDSLLEVTVGYFEEGIKENIFDEAYSIDDFFGSQIDYGFVSKLTREGVTEKNMVAFVDGAYYVLGYSCKSSFYDETIWENFLSQMKMD